MSSPKTFKRYEERWLDLFNRFQDDPTQEIPVECKDERTAKAFRLEFYKAREALLHDDPAWYKAEYFNLDRKRVVVEGRTAIFGFKDDSWVAKAIDDALEKFDAAHPTRDAHDGEGAA